MNYFTPIFEEKEHRYFHPTEKHMIPSVTTILESLQIIPPFSAVKNIELYADRGSCVHKVLELIALNSDNIPGKYNEWKNDRGIDIAWSEVSPYVEGGKKFLAQLESNFLKPEVLFGTNDYCGTVDLLVDDCDVYDFKTSKKVSYYHLIQAAGYALIFGGDGYIVQLKEDGTFQLIKADDKYKKIWKDLVSLYYQDIPHEEKISQASMIAKEQKEIPPELGNRLLVTKECFREIQKQLKADEAAVIDFLTVDEEITPGYFKNERGSFSVSSGGRITMGRKKVENNG